MAQELFELPGGKIVSFNPGGRFHGWIFRRGRDGNLVSEQKLNPIELPDPFASLPNISKEEGMKMRGQPTRNEN